MSAFINPDDKGPQEPLAHLSAERREKIERLAEELCAALEDMKRAKQPFALN